MSQDIARHLAGETVIARKPTLDYRARKYVRRNKARIAFAAVITLVMIGVTAFSIRQSQVARQQARDARRAAYPAQMNQALGDLESGNIKSARALVENWLPKPGEEDLRGFEWRYLWRLLNREDLTLPHDEWVKRAKFISNEESMTETGVSGTVRFWDLKTGRLLKTVSSIRGPFPFDLLNRTIQHWDAGTVPRA